MRRIVIISPSVVWLEGSPEFIHLDDLLAQKPTTDSLLVAIVPDTVGRVVGSARTLESALAHQFPGQNSFATVPLDAHSYQAYVSSDELLDSLRKLSRHVRVVPYPAALMAMLGGPRTKKSFVERTQVLIRGSATETTSETEKKSTLIIETFGEEHLMVATAGSEVLAVRLAKGHVATEALRTLVAARLENPVVYCTDEVSALDLEAQGLDVEPLSPSGPVAAAAYLNKVEAAEFQNALQREEKRRNEAKKTAKVMVAVAAGILLATLAAFLYFSQNHSSAVARSRNLEAEKQQHIDELAKLYSQHYGYSVRAKSLQLHDEMFDLSMVLPPQVEMLSVTKDSVGTTAVLERRPQATPFGPDDLKAALQASTYFSAAKISETYDGHLIRYSLKVPSKPKP